jgi:hypothetical protein
VDGEHGSAHDEGLCSHDSWPKKGRALARRWRAQRVGADGKPELGDTRRNKGTTPLQGKGARAAMTAASPASDWLGSMAGSQATAGLRGGAVRDSGQHTSSDLTRLGPASARRQNSTARGKRGAHLGSKDVVARRC